MQARDICSIIKACAKSGVSELKLGDMQIKFEGSKLSVRDEHTLGSLGTGYSDVGHGNGAPPEQLELNVEGFSEDIDQVVDQTQLMIDSPVDYEQSIIDSYLENESTDEGLGDSHEAYGFERSQRDLSNF